MKVADGAAGAVVTRQLPTVLLLHAPRHPAAAGGGGQTTADDIGGGFGETTAEHAIVIRA